MRLIGIAGYKQGGKSSLCNYIVGLEMVALGLIEYFKMAESGKLLVPGEFEEGIREIEFDPARFTGDNIGWFFENLWPNVQVYACADAIKREICVNILGLDENKFYGSDDDKNSPTNYLWSNMPWPASVKKGKLGYMTHRELMQILGTEIFRAIDSDVWSKLIIRKIEQDNKMYGNENRICLIGDVRFDNEAKAIRDAGGKIIWLTHQPYKDDKDNKHKSELGVDPSLVDFTVDNSNMTMEEKNEAVLSILVENGILDYTINKKESVETSEII